MKNKVNASVLFIALFLGGLSMVLPTEALSYVKPVGEYSYVCCNADECSGGDECTGDGSFTCCS